MINSMTKWIWTKDWQFIHNEFPGFVAFRRAIILDAIPKRASVRVSADSRYKLYVNGKLINVGPRKGDAQVWFYDELDLTNALKNGENVIYAVVLRYPLDIGKGNASVWRTEIPGLYMEGDIFLENGNRVSLDAGPSFKTKIMKNRRIISESPWFAPLQILEEACGDQEMAQAMFPGFDDRSWTNAVCYPDIAVNRVVSPGNLLPRPIPLLYRKHRTFIEDIRHLEISANSHKRLVVDAGELNTGYLSLKLAAGKGSVVHILTSESYASDPEPDGFSFMPLPVKGDRTDSVHGKLFGFTDIYTVAGYGSDVSCPEVYDPFWFRTFRFVQLDIETGSEPLVILSFDYEETGYPLEVVTAVSTSDPEYQAIWDISLRTLRRCMHETYEDCPFYEQLQYSMDTRTQILYTYMVSGDDRLARQCMDDFHRSQFADGNINCSAPRYDPFVIPGFSIYYILMIYDHMMFYGDRDLVCRYMPTVEAILGYFGRNLDKRGIVKKIGGLNGRARYWSFIDWTPEWDATSGVPRAILDGPITMESLLYMYGLIHAAKLLRFIGRNEEAENLEACSEAVGGAVRRYCLGRNSLLQDGPGIEDYSQHCQVFAVLTGLFKGAEARRVMAEVLRKDASYTKCSVAMAFYLFRAAQMAGLYDRTHELWDPWRKMLANHLTTCVEDSLGERSDCHAWGALMLYELPAAVLGVQPGAPGYKVIRVAPERGHLTEASGTVTTPKGTVFVHWCWDGQRMNIEAKGPENVDIEIVEALEEGTIPEPEKRAC